MCLILFSYDTHPDYWLILAANRDEFYNRPTHPLGFWTDNPNVLAGRDLRGDGTWLGVTTTGRIAAVTNFRDPKPYKEKAPSRGNLVRDYLTGDDPPQRYLEQIKTNGYRYNGFNLIAGNNTGLYYYSNRAKQVHKLKPGLYGISNHLLDTSWPKVSRGKAELQKQFIGNDKIDIQKILSVLTDRSLPADDELPDTGVGLEWERILSPLFIISDDYGTRSSSIVLMEKSGRVTFVERTFLEEASEIKESETRRYSFTLSGRAPV
jgi:uncharacterized protein with NRDE domain